MRLYGTPYLLGMCSLLLGERLLFADTAMRVVFSGLGLGLLLFALFQTIKKRPSDNKAFTYPTYFCGIGLSSIFAYALGLEQSVDTLGLVDKGAHQFQTVISVLWPILWLCGTLPLIALAVLIDKGHKHVQPKRALTHAFNWLGVAFTLVSIVALNYTASKSNVRWNVTYFKTTSPGDSTQNIVANLSTPISIHLFFSQSSDVKEEIRSYFDALRSDKLSISYVDHSLEPELAKELKIRNNGYIALSVGDDENKQTKSINIGSDFNRAKRNLKKLDSLVREKLLALSKGPQKIYVTTGHGEFYWKSKKEKDPLREISVLKSSLRSSNFSMSELSVVTAIPEDAAMVLVLGPTEEFLDVEIEVLNEYRENGGSLLLCLEPGGSSLEGLLSPLGLAFNNSAFLSNATAHVPIQKGPTDIRNLFSTKYSTHASVGSFGKLSKTYPSFFFGAGVLTKDKESKATATVRSMEKTFDDSNGNFKFDSGTETQKVWDIGYAWSKSLEEKDARVVVMSDTSWLSDFILKKSDSNKILIGDVLTWLLNDTTSAGAVNDEQDVKVIHTKGAQGSIFYGTILLIPIGLFIFGNVYVRNRRRKGAH